MIYLFECVETAQRFEAELAHTEVCDFGETMVIEGKTLRRVLVAPAVQVRPNLVVQGWSREPGTCPGATAYKDPVTGAVNREDVTGDGVPLYDSIRDLQATEKATDGRQTFTQLQPDS